VIGVALWLSMAWLAAACAAGSTPIPTPTLIAEPSDVLPECRLTYERDEAGPGATFYGSGFAADTSLTLIISPSDGEPITLIEDQLPELHSDVRGAFEAHLSAERGDVGVAEFEVSDGECAAATIVETPAEVFPVECATDDKPAASGGAASEAYATDVLADGPLRYWRFEEADGTELADEVGGGPATLVGDGTLGQPGFLDGSRAVLLQPDAAGDWLAIPALELERDFTVEGWIRLCGDRVTNRDALVGQAGEGPDVNFHDWYVRLWSGEHDPAVAGVPVPSRGWFHVAVVRQAGRLQLYQEGQLVGNGEYAGSFRIAALGGGAAGSLEGWLDEVAIYDHALSPERVAAHAAHAR
jgi:hypothetical protein